MLRTVLHVQGGFLFRGRTIWIIYWHAQKPLNISSACTSCMIFVWQEATARKYFIRFYNKKLQSFSLIEAEYLLSTPYESTDIYIFLDQLPEPNSFFCRSFFPKEDKDYTKGQAVYTLLKKEKTILSTGNTIIQYDRLTPKNDILQTSSNKIFCDGKAG